MKQYYKQFTSKVEMIEAVSTLSPKLDTKAMLDFIPKGSPRRLYVITDEGKMFPCDTFKKFLSIANSIGDLEFLHPICSGRGGTLFNLYSKKDYFGTEGDKFIPEIKQPEIIVEVKPQPLIVLDMDTEKSSEKVDEVIVDWEMINSLQNKKHDKIKLEEYAKGFGVDLKRNKTLENMIIDFKAFLDSK